MHVISSKFIFLIAGRPNRHISSPLTTYICSTAEVVSPEIVSANEPTTFKCLCHEHKAFYCIWSMVTWELILVLFVRLFDLCLFGFVGFLFLLGSRKGCGLWLWHSLDFSLTFFYLIVSTYFQIWQLRKPQYRFLIWYKLVSPLML